MIINLIICSGRVVMNNSGLIYLFNGIDIIMQKSEARAENIELIRIIACLMVIFNHSNDRGFYRYAIYDISSFSWILSTLISAMCKVGVPLFYDSGCKLAWEK